MKKSREQLDKIVQSLFKNREIILKELEKNSEQILLAKGAYNLRVEDELVDSSDALAEEKEPIDVPSL